VDVPIKARHYHHTSVASDIRTVRLTKNLSSEFNKKTLVMCLERPKEQAVSEIPVSMTDYTLEKGFDFDFKYGQSQAFECMDNSVSSRSPSSSPRVRRKHHRRKLRGKKKYRFPSTFFEPSLENIDEEKEIEIDPLRLGRKEKKLSSKHRERALEGGSRSSLDDGRRFRHRHYLKREKAST
jgi:hypothetical protein